MRESTICVSGHGFTFEVPNKQLRLPDKVVSQVRKQPQFALETFIGRRMNDADASPARDLRAVHQLFKFTNPRDQSIRDPETRRLIAEAKRDPTFIAKWRDLEALRFPHLLSVQGLKHAMKLHYPEFLKSNGLIDSPASVNAYALLVAREHQKEAEKISRHLARTNPEEIRLFGSFNEPGHQLLDWLSNGLIMNLEAINLSPHAGYQNPLMKFLDEYNDVVYLSATSEGRAFFGRYGLHRQKEAFASALRMRKTLEPLGLL